MSDERFLVGNASLRHIDEIIHDAVLEAEQEVEVPQARIRVDEHDLLAAHREPHAEIGRRRRLAYAALAGCDYDNFTHLVSYLSIGSMTIWPSLMEARSGRVGRSLAAGVLSGARAMRSAMRICVGTRQSAITKASWLP